MREDLCYGRSLKGRKTADVSNFYFETLHGLPHRRGWATQRPDIGILPDFLKPP